MDLFSAARQLSLNHAEEDELDISSPTTGRKLKKKKSDSDLKEEEERRRKLRAALMIQSAWRFKKLKDTGG